MATRHPMDGKVGDATRSILANPRTGHRSQTSHSTGFDPQFLFYIDCSGSRFSALVAAILILALLFPQERYFAPNQEGLSLQTVTGHTRNHQMVKRPDEVEIDRSSPMLIVNDRKNMEAATGSI